MASALSTRADGGLSTLRRAARVLTMAPSTSPLADVTLTPLRMSSAAWPSVSNAQWGSAGSPPVETTAIVRRARAALTGGLALAPRASYGN